MIWGLDQQKKKWSCVNFSLKKNKNERDFTTEKNQFKDFLKDGSEKERAN